MIIHDINSLKMGIFEKDDLLFFQDRATERVIITHKEMDEICEIWEKYKSDTIKKKEDLLVEKMNDDLLQELLQDGDNSRHASFCGCELCDKDTVYSPFDGDKT